MRRLLCLLLCILVVLASCSSGPRVARVKGRITVAGKPVPSGQITFHSENGRSALGQIDAEGNYTLTTFEPGDGAIVGNHIVTIQATKVGPGGMGFASPEDEMRWTEQGMKKGKVGGKILIPGKVEWLVPEVYASPQTTKLKATVEDKDNTINFEIEK